MKHKNFLATVSRALAVMTGMLVVTLMLAPSAWAQSKYKVLHQFSSDYPQHYDGLAPYGGLIFDAAGNLYGTTASGGEREGTVFKLTPNTDGSWTESVLYGFGFNGGDGSSPMAGPILDAAGNLYGTTYLGGGQGVGTVFDLTPNPDGSWTHTVLHTFYPSQWGDAGIWPYAGLILDAAGNLYGTTVGGGAYGYGVVFELTPNLDGSWTESVLYSFTGGTDGANPYAGLIFDNTGNLYGATVGGGLYGYGVVFKLKPHANGSWTEKVLHKFTGGKEGANPYAALVFDIAGNLYGTTVNGGPYGYGVAYKLTPNTAGCWTPKILHKFTGGKDGANPYAALVLDAAGNLYGTTWAGGTHGLGVVFKLNLGPDGKWGEHVLHAFAGQPARNPYAGLVLDRAGNLYGTTATGDTDCSSYWSHQDCGAVFEITP